MLTLFCVYVVVCYALALLGVGKLLAREVPEAWYFGPILFMILLCPLYLGPWVMISGVQAVWKELGE